MTKYLHTAVYIFLGCVLISFEANAEEKSTSTGASTDNALVVSKEQWLKAVTPLLPDLICKGFENDPQLKKRLDDIKMNYEQCVAKIPDSISKCQQQLYGSIPDKIDNDSAAVWGKSLGECIGKDFAIKYLIPQS
ncbi:hypothetical protein OQJ18_03585 [Fluoribacter dumoffii]|uniref:T2SS substrate NttA domain-containing protein n=1 Tax=Fluoribacter dumoffii TaxID=463 RepID=A0A377GAV3_9GAMM|nr:hypothetical protein [Fluoribacter dumoffii]KTC88985.1 hypothetical protein Ldum_3243 [Fluoribacter dumoffii NY 23]MCW8385803.1 hypothetical protein [Fluoribacter dumoffii]MCW8418836.1 hypothetical protein [Fluoribacter dumoffii]MCW8453320.1 hypothetical protein [Fluoribacter dumoffii]MCW8459459.1 hypothetical protein [Fluoribacter dumoffii]